MHQENNTLGGVYGFVAVYPDATVRTEFDFTWDELPMDKPLKALRLVDAVNNIIMLELAGYERYFFSNEATSGMVPHARPGLGNFMLTGKIFGAFDKHNGAVEIYVDMTQLTPVARQNRYAVQSCPFAPHACRMGVVT